MNKTRKMKLLSFLLCFVMLVGWISTSALAAEKEIIDSISATVTLPTAGSHPVETGTPGDSSYTITKVSFSKKEDNGLFTSLDSSDTFEAGETYKINVLFRPTGGYTIQSDASATINGMNAEYWSTISDGWNSRYFYIDYTVPKEIAVLPLTIPVPVVGETTNTNGISIDTKGLSITNAQWYSYKKDVGYMALNKFPLGTTCYLMINYEVAEGYAVATNAQISHNLIGGKAEHNPTNKTVMIEYTVRETYTVTVNNDNNGTAQANVSKAVKGTTVTLTATPNEGYEFDKWEIVSGGVTPADITASTTTFIMPAENVVVKAVFKEMIVTPAPTEIENPSATVTLPTAGSYPIETGTPGDSSYKIISVHFYDDAKQLTTSDPFEAGITYRIYVTFRANSGFKIENTANVTINGLNATYWNTIADGWDSKNFYIEYTVPAAESTPITSIKVSDVTAPVIGATPDFDITLTGEGAALYEYEEDEWDAITWDKLNPDTGEWESMDKDTPFGAGLYCLGVALQPEDGYAITDATKFYYNDDELPEFGGSYESNYQLWGGGVDIYLYFTLEESATPTEIVNLSATVTKPVAGAFPSFEAVAGGEGYTAELEWEIVAEETIIYPEDYHKFKAGEEYGLWVAFNLKDDYAFADDVTITINGMAPEDTYKYEDKIVGLVTYTVPAATPITSVKIDGVIQPVIGAMPDFDFTLTGDGATIDEDEDNGWWKVEPETHHWELMDEDTPFSAGLYVLGVCLKAKDGYQFTDDTKFYFGENELSEYYNSYESNYERWDGGAGIYLYFQSTTSAKPNYGDVDGDGSVSAADALEVLKSVVGKVTLTDEQTVKADVDGSGKVYAADALDILKKVVGKIEKFAVEG